MHHRWKVLLGAIGIFLASNFGANEAEEARIEFEPGEVLVKFAETTAEERIRQILAGENAQVDHLAVLPEEGVAAGVVVVRDAAVDLRVAALAFDRPKHNLL